MLNAGKHISLIDYKELRNVAEAETYSHYLCLMMEIHWHFGSTC